MCRIWNLRTLLVGREIVQLLWKTVWQVLKTLNTELSSNSKPKCILIKLKMCVHTKSRT